jgi:hypothetical protein
MKNLIFLITLIFFTNMATAQLAGNWKGDATDVAKNQKMQATLNLADNGTQITGKLSLFLNGVQDSEVDFQSYNRSSSSMALCQTNYNGYEIRVNLFETKGTMIMSVYLGEKNVMNGTFKRDNLSSKPTEKSSRSTESGAMNIDPAIVGVWKWDKYESRTKTTMFVAFKPDGTFEGYQNSFFSTGYGGGDTSASLETTNEPIPWLDKMNQAGGRWYTKNGSVWLKIPNERDTQFFYYQINGYEMIMNFGKGGTKTAERIQ